MEGLSSSHGTCIESCLDQCRQLYKTFPADICLAVLLGFIIGNACRGISEIWSACVCKWLKSLFICIRTAFIRGLVQWLTYRGYEVTPKEDGQKDTGSYVKRHPHVTHDTVKKTGALPPLLLNSLKNTPVTSPRLIGCSTSTSPVAFCISPCSCSLGSDSSLSPCSVFANMALPRSGPVSPLQSMADATRKRSNLRPPSAVPNLKAFDARNRLISSADIRDRLEDAAASCDVRYPASKYFNVQRSEASSWACTPVQTPSGPACSVRFEANDEDNRVIGERENRTFLPVAVWMCGPDLAHLTLDRGSGWLDHVAPSLEEIYGPEWEQNIHGEDLNRCRVLICSALETKAPFQLEYRLKAQTNQYRWILDTCKIRTSDDGAFLGFVGWRIDIHERKLIEFEHESYWSLPCEFFVRLGSDMEHFELISPSMPHMLGYTMEEILKMKTTDLLHPNDIDSTREEFKTLEPGKFIINLVNRYRCKEGQNIEGKVFRDSTGTYKWINWTTSHLFGAGRDITSEKIAQIELQRSREELKRITDSIPGGVFQYKVDENGVGTFPFVSKGAMHVFGTESKPIASSDSEGMTIYKEDLVKLKDAMQQAKQLETSLDCDYRVVQNGEVRWVRVHAVRQKGQGDSIEWCGLIWDMTEDRIQVNTLKEERDNAERAAQTKARFLANMSHEIRTPMNAVIGMGSLLLETDLDDEQREYVTTICSSGESLLSIINDILDFSKIEAGKMELEAKAFDLMRCIEESLDLFLPQAASKGVELNYTVTDMVPAAVSGDVVRIRQILVNLLSNAMKFTEKGCICINLSACKLQECTEGSGKISYDTTPSLGQSLYKPWEIHFAVKDNGIGIPQDRINSLFQAFTQVDTSTTRKYGGTGLGLAICARLCTLHGGRIWVESSYGHGSTFHFTVIAEEAILTSEEKTSDKDAMKEKRVLIVAKSSTSSQVMCNKFTKSWGMRPLMAITIIEALQVLKRALEISSKNQVQKSSVWNDPFSVAIIDSAMFQGEETQLIECVKLCQAVVPQIPVILLTPYGQKNQDSEYGIEFSGYVSKPVKSAHLLKSLMNIVCKTELPVPTRSHSTDIGIQEDMGKNFPMKILVAEDNIINQKVLKKLLEKLGYVADYVDTGCKAIDSIKRERYDVCLMDCFMPEMDGLEATKHLRAMVDPCPIIVAVTAAALEEEKQACLEAGMHMYISKPIQAEVLKRTLYKCWKIKEGMLDIGSLQL